jgi:hypothetical protein
MTSTMRFDKWENSLGEAYGTVVQAVQFIDRGQSGSGRSTRVTTTSQTFSTLMSQSIITKLPNSKIIILASATCFTSGGVQRAKARLTRNGTEVNADQYAFYTDNLTFALHTFNNLDSPNVPAGTTLNYSYDVGAASANGINHFFGYGDQTGGTSTSIVLLEIAQ